MTLSLISECVRAGARQHKACELVGLSARTLERWRGGSKEDGRRGARRSVANSLTFAERECVLRTVNEAGLRDLSPNQIVPRLADAGVYVASESTIYRILRAESQLRHRGRARAGVRRRPREYVATGANQVWSWDITYLGTQIRGVFFYLYLIMDVWSRKIVGWAVHGEELAAHAARLFEEICRRDRLDPAGLVLHADNGGPMKGATMVATLERLGVLASFSRPSVSNDNPFSEALFRTLKYRPEYPEEAFEDLGRASEWVSGFVQWYNTEHRHSAIRFVTPHERHSAMEREILARREAVYAKARSRNPERWSGETRNWAPIGEVRLNPSQRPNRSMHASHDA